ncbi:MAG: PKD domain-containing protein [Acidobacteriota bacterium]
MVRNSDLAALRRYVGILLFLLAAAVPSRATTIVLASDDQLVAKSPVIVIGTVASSQAIERNGGIWTETKLTVDETLRGTTRGEVVIRQVGGQLADRGQIIYGSPSYSPGERVLVFLAATQRGDYQTMDLFVGKFTERFTTAGERVWFRPATVGGTALFDQDFKLITSTTAQRDASGFEQFVRARVSGTALVPRYLIQDPQFAPSIGAKFTTISEPNILRWFTFDTGGSVSWKSTGTQPGYPNGGVDEAKTGMNAWTNYNQSSIKYLYSGVSSSPPGGLSSGNGINEIMFNDPKDEIPGSWNGTSGVVGQGGPYYTTSPRSWTSPFAADASHPQSTFGAWQILEANLTVQDGVSPSARINSGLLAEIIAHEFGHTLGLGHSSDTLALMYYSVAGYGPTLRSDDQLAARWLYPSGSSPTPTPAPTPTPTPNPTISAAFTASSISGFAGTTSFVFTDQSSGPVVSRQWNFGDGTGSTLSAPSHAYSAAGSYVVSLTVYGSSGNQASATKNITVSAPNSLTAEFQVSPTSGIAGVTNFRFTDKSSGTISSWLWTFGDDTTSNMQSPTHTYQTAGTYSVRLLINGSGGTQATFTRTVSVAAQTSSVSAAFTYSPQAPTVDTTISFVDQSVGGPATWTWSFGDGQGSNAQNPSHRYTVPGTYPVSLTVALGSGTSTVTDTVTVSAGAGGTQAVSAGFDVSSDSVAVGQTITFLDRSLGGPTSWSWNFGDGQTSSLQNPAHNYAAPGGYSVTLTAARGAVTSISSRTISVTQLIQSFRSLVPVTTQTAGAGTTYWRTELTLYNAGTETLDVFFNYVPGAGVAPQTRTITLGAGASLTYDNALPQIFGIVSGSGGLNVEATSATSKPDLRISSRTFTSGVDGTFGQYVPDVGNTLPATTYLTGLSSNAQYRTNVGLVNRGNATANVILTLYDASGSVIATNPVSVPPNNFQQNGLTAFFPQIAGQSVSGLSMKVQAPFDGAVSCYASNIDNRSQDPVFLAAAPMPVTETLMVPAVARLDGAGGTFWRSDVTLFNPTSNTMYLTFSLLLADVDNRTVAASKSAQLLPGRTLSIGDIFTWMGAANGKGALRITSSGAGAAPVASSRTYTTRASDGGTYGQSIDVVEATQFARDGIITGLKSDASYRTNLGFVNSGNDPIGVTVTLYNSTGLQIGSAFLSVAPMSQTQPSLANLFPGVNAAALGGVTVRAHTDTAATLLTYGSVIDNGSGDPIFVRGK